MHVFLSFPAHGNIGLQWPQMGPVLFPTDPDLANMLGRTDFDFENSDSLDLLFLVRHMVEVLNVAFTHGLKLHMAFTYGPDQLVAKHCVQSLTYWVISKKVPQSRSDIILTHALACFTSPGSSHIW